MKFEFTEEHEKKLYEAALRDIPKTPVSGSAMTPHRLA